jgi:hypothetical protein
VESEPAAFSVEAMFSKIFPKWLSLTIDLA